MLVPTLGRRDRRTQAAPASARQMSPFCASANSELPCAATAVMGGNAVGPTCSQGPAASAAGARTRRAAIASQRMERSVHRRPAPMPMLIGAAAVRRARPRRTRRPGSRRRAANGQRQNDVRRIARRAPPGPGAGSCRSGPDAVCEQHQRVVGRARGDASTWSSANGCAWPLHQPSGSWTWTTTAARRAPRACATRQARQGRPVSVSAARCARPARRRRAARGKQLASRRGRRPPRRTGPRRAGRQSARGQPA